ncbi:DUF3078 domain-containing protein [Flavobacterium sp. NST-5]|uniref:DUF3078 domain-containing protein n=1 Tax=Flavobacterium ichthyis TaxID=2698827 RepID=A0ABW9Z9K9_9FLAO|nr:DUF3078 domain-containing protein [Flavobacterium ichthyis]NBL65560.1 DUF3078 domain-containing protein [Flavobacterium ichthyis]
MRSFLITLGLFFSFVTAKSQTGDTIVAKSVDTIKPPKEVSHWERKNILGFDLSEIAFVNWAAGGNSSISGLLKGNFIRKYENGNLRWNNEMIIRYGVSKQDGIELRKTDDAFQFNSTFGYRKDTTSNWFHSAKFTFSTQFTNGYAYPNTEVSISTPFAPAYTFFGFGAEYHNKPINLNLYLSPLTFKNTLVLNQRLANQGAFGVTRAVIDPVTGEVIVPGKKSRTEVGILITAAHKAEIIKNINLENKLQLYTDYLNNFGNIDIDWQMQLDFVVNKYVRANINTHLIYDHDIKAKEEINGEQVTVGPKIQFKQALGIGLIYSF